MLKQVYQGLISNFNNVKSENNNQPFHSQHHQSRQNISHGKYKKYDFTYMSPKQFDALINDDEVKIDFSSLKIESSDANNELSDKTYNTKINYFSFFRDRIDYLYSLVQTDETKQSIEQYQHLLDELLQHQR